MTLSTESCKVSDYLSIQSCKISGSLSAQSCKITDSVHSIMSVAQVSTICSLVPHRHKEDLVLTVYVFCSTPDEHHQTKRMASTLSCTALQGSGENPFTADYKCFRSNFTPRLTGFHRTVSHLTMERVGERDKLLW